jgi:hypothetical protein
MASAASVYLSANQAYTSSDPAVVEFDTKVYDINGDFNTTTHRFVAPEDGKYLVCYMAQFAVTAEDDGLYATVTVNDDDDVAESAIDAPTAGNHTLTGQKLIDLEEDDYVELYVTNSDNDDTIQGGSEYKTYMTITQIQ